MHLCYSKIFKILDRFGLVMQLSSYIISVSGEGKHILFLFIFFVVAIFQYGNHSVRQIQGSNGMCVCNTRLSSASMLRIIFCGHKINIYDFLPFFHRKCCIFFRWFLNFQEGSIAEDRESN